MGKQAKKKQKSEAQIKGQKRHNKANRGINTKRRPILWETRERVKKDKDGNEVIEQFDVTYPPNILWDWSRIYDAVTDDEGITRLVRRKPEKQKPLPAPLDTLLDDTWEEDLQAYADDHNAGVSKTPVGGGRFTHEVWREEYSPITGKNERRVLLTVAGARSTKVPTTKKRKKFSRKRKN